MNSQKTRAILIGAGTFPKDDSLQDIPSAFDDLKQISKALTDAEGIALPESHLAELTDTIDNTSIKEAIASAAEQAESLLLVYYSGYLMLRKGKLYLATANTTQRLAYVNALSLTEVAAIVADSEARNKVILLEGIYNTTDSATTEAIEKEIPHLLNSLKANTDNLHFILAPAGITHEQKEETGTTFTAALQQLMLRGMKINSSTIGLEDAKKFISQILPEGKSPLASSAANSNTVLFPNARYNKFDSIKHQAAELLEQEDFAQAAPLFNEAATLYPDDEELEKKRVFVQLMLEAERNFQGSNYKESHRLYEKAVQSFDNAAARKGLKKSLDRLADRYYEEERYDKAKEIYAQLSKLDKENNVYKSRLEVAETEMRFDELMTEADRQYFKLNFSEAAKHYKQVLTIHHDHRIQRRYDECVNLLKKEEEIRKRVTEELETELRQKLSTDVQSELEQQKKELTEQLQQELKGSVEKDYKQQLEEQFWQRASMWDQAEAYQFYLSFFPHGNFVDKARRRIDEINKQKEAEREAAAEREAQLNQQAQATKPKAVEPDKSELETDEDDRMPLQFKQELPTNAQGRIQLSEVLKDSKAETDGELYDFLNAAKAAEKEVMESTTSKVVAKKPVDEGPFKADSVKAETTAEADKQEVTQPAEQVTKLPDATPEAENVAIQNATAEEEEADDDDMSLPVPSFFDEEEEDDQPEENDQPVEQQHTTETQEDTTETLAEISESAPEERYSESFNNDVHDSAEDTSDATEEAFVAESKTVEHVSSEPSAWEEEADLATDDVFPEDKFEPAAPAEEEVKPVEEIITGAEDTGTDARPALDLESFSEEALWDYATKGNTVESFMDYVNTTRESLHIADAYYMINKLNREKAAAEQPQQEVKEPLPATATKSGEREATEEATKAEAPQPERRRLGRSAPKHEEVPGAQKEEDTSFLEDLSEEGLWNYATKLSTVEAYMQYIDYTKDSKYIADAYSKINKLNHANDEDTEAAPVIPDVKPEEVAVEQAPVQSADKPITNIHDPNHPERVSVSNDEEQLWQAAKEEDTISAYFNYLNTTKEKMYWKDAKSRINTLKQNSQEQEQKDWVDTQMADTVDAYREYIRKYPLGNYYAKAMFRLNKLETEGAN